MPRKATRPWDTKIMCAIWRDAEFTALDGVSQLACIHSIGNLGRDRSMGGMRYTNVELGLDEFTFARCARQLVPLGVWTWVDIDAVEVWPFKDLIVPIKSGIWRQPIGDHIRRMVLARDGWACRHCGATERLEIDHIHPWSKGGTDHSSNLQTLCRACNWRKGASV